ncbi:alanine dehydrogenase [Gammaproteobacteria bacterium]|nr:alanine dehydrogenase [Gammaproteobacteria bacterium]MDC6460104.1 alanine dehydrogenase [Gammaproteobacteria bacterium]
MKIGVPKEIKNNEYRVGLTPRSVQILSNSNHQVYIQKDSGAEIGFLDEHYQNAGAKILTSPEKVYELSELIIKVKEPIPEEYKYLNENHTVFAYLHLAGNKKNAIALTSTGISGIALETVTAEDGSMPLLSPMSSIAGQLSIIVGSYHLLKPYNGMGTLIGEIENIDPRIVTVIGAGVAGTEAIKKAINNKAYLKVIDLSKEKLKDLQKTFGNNNIEYIESTELSIEEALKVSDLVIGSVYVLGKQAPKVVTNNMLRKMKQGAVIVDISIDQGGCFESSIPTTHDNPTYVKDGVIHYCVTNMPGAVPLTATEALNKATLPYILELANKGVDLALKENIHLANGLNIKNGKVVHSSVREALIL